MAETKENSPDLWRNQLPQPVANGHKYDRGHTLVLSGGPASTGAARLAAIAALRIGAGLVSVASPGSALLVNAAHLTAVMVKRADTPDELTRLIEENRVRSIIAGPGLGVGVETREKTLALLNSRCGLVLDADALTSFEKQTSELFDALEQHGRCVLTPHEGEFARLFPDLAADKDRARKTTKAAARSNAVIVLKGAETVIADPFGWTVVNRHASPWLATAGSGDVLAGIIGGLVAQGMLPFDAACASVWMHGEAGQRGGPGLVAEDLPDLLPGVLAPFFD